MGRELLALVCGVAAVGGVVWVSVRTLADGDPLTFVLVLAAVGLALTAVVSGRYDREAAAVRRQAREDRRRMAAAAAAYPVANDGRVRLPNLPRDTP